MAKKKTQNLSRSFGFNSPDYSTGGNLYFLGGIKPPTEMQSGIGSAAGVVGGMIPTNTRGGAAASGALQGAQLGMTVGGPWGAAIGALGFGAAGLISQDNKMNRADFASENDAMRQRNEMLDIKANGGSLKSYEVSNTKPFDDWYNSQPFYTEALQNKYNDLPTKEILNNALNDKSFSNSKLNQYNDSLMSKYGNKYLTSSEVDSIAKRNNIPNIFDLDNQIKESELSGIGSTNNTMGSKENTLNKYGYRMMLNRSFPKGQSPYKSAGGYILPQGVSANMATEYAQGGMLTEFNAGGSHSENKFGGILQGQSPDGQDNKVEQGETKYQDYIFSDRLKLDEQAVNEHNLPKSMINKTFADASKRISKLHKERPHDPITRDTMRSKMDHLMMANDEVREYEQGSMMSGGGKINKAKPTKEELDASLFYHYPTKNDLLYQNNKVTSDSAQYVAGYRSNLTPENKFPIGWKLDSPSRAGYFQRSVDFGKLNTKPGIYPSIKKAGGGHLYDGLSEKTGFLNFEDPRVLDRFINPDTPMNKLGYRGRLFGENLSKSATGLESDKLNTYSANMKQKGLDAQSKLNAGFFGDSKNLRYAPIAFNALAGSGLFGKSPAPDKYNPTLIQQQGTLSAPQVDEQTMRANIDSAYQNQIRGMADVSGGSGAALRSGLSGLSNDYMSAVGQGFLGADTANKQAQMQADQYNLGTSQNVASQNAQMQNQAGLYNNQMINQNNALNYDNKMSYLGKGAEGLGDIGYEARNAEILPRLFGYNQYGEYKPLNAKACGGRLRMMRRKK